MEMRYSLLLLTLTILACRAPAAREPAIGELHGPTLERAIPKPDFTLTTTEGREFRFRRDTEGKVALLFFGYTHCPDVCPVHMANIGRVLAQLPGEIRGQITVVFVTTDPERDSPARLAAWLGKFDPAFIGLTGTQGELGVAQSAANIMPAVREYADSTGKDSTTYFVGHAAQVLAYTMDDSLHVLYPFGIRQEDWANDLPLLVRKWRGGK